MYNKANLIEGTIKQVIRKAINIATIYIEVTNQYQNFTAGQFITIDPAQFPELNSTISFFEEQKKKKEPVRAYSILSTPFDSLISITVKIENFKKEYEYPPILSPFLCSMQVNKKIIFNGFFGNYTLPSNFSNNSNKQILHIICGTGIIPTLSIIKTDLFLNQFPKTKHIIIVVNRTSKDSIFLTSLSLMKLSYFNRLEIISFFSSNTPPGLLKQTIIQHSTHPNTELIFACGSSNNKWIKLKYNKRGINPPEKFMEFIYNIMKEINIPKPKFRSECYN